MSDTKNPSVDFQGGMTLARPGFVAERPHPLSGDHLAREGRLARASALLLMQFKLYNKWNPKSNESVDPEPEAESGHKEGVDQVGFRNSSRLIALDLRPFLLLRILSICLGLSLP
jgi:hypothetical protein